MVVAGIVVLVIGRTDQLAAGNASLSHMTRCRIPVSDSLSIDHAVSRSGDGVGLIEFQSGLELVIGGRAGRQGRFGAAEDIGGQITEVIIEHYHVGESELAAVA